jgi:hypothetical protein
MRRTHQVTHEVAVDAETMDVSKLADGNDRRHELKAFEGHQGFNRGRDSPFALVVCAQIFAIDDPLSKAHPKRVHGGADVAIHYERFRSAE